MGGGDEPGLLAAGPRAPQCATKDARAEGGLQRQRAGNQYDRRLPVAVADELWRVLVVEAAKRYAVAAALALDLPRDFFSKTLQQLDLCTLRFLHYPALPPSPEEQFSARASTRTLASRRSSSSAARPGCR